MKIIRRGQIVYYIKDEVVIIGVYDNQFSAYTVYPLQNRKPFYDFRREILESDESQFNNVLDMMSLTMKYKLRGIATHRPKITGE